MLRHPSVAFNSVCQKCPASPTASSPPPGHERCWLSLAPYQDNMGVEEVPQSTNPSATSPTDCPGYSTLRNHCCGQCIHQPDCTIRFRRPLKFVRLWMDGSKLHQAQRGKVDSYAGIRCVLHIRPQLLWHLPAICPKLLRTDWTLTLTGLQ